ncbi:MAG: ornithine cyclodeaminase family protein [Actinobacteria bacterium]|nr:MAG: ornithine cyclodeaminase family protein [Actinomycetota bacterium]
MEIRFLSARDVEQVAPEPAEVIAAIETVVRAQGNGEVVLEPRVHLEPGASFNGHWNVLRAFVAPLGTAGVKVVGDFVDNYLRGLPSELGLLTLYEPETGAPTAIVDAADLTDRRTGAFTAVGAKYLARRDSRVLGHVGARGTAFWNIVMLNSLFGFDEIRVTSRRAESRDAFAQALERELGKPVRACETVEETVEGADVVVEATRLVEPEPILRTAWIAEGAFVVPYGTMSAVELDLLSVMSKVVVDDWEQCKPGGRFGSLRAHVEQGLLTKETLHGELGDVVVGRVPGRETDDERILFWHRGLATCDVALGALLVERAAERGVGTILRYR